MPWSRDDITRLIELEAHQRDIDPRLALALAAQENPRFDPEARSPKGAIGIMQLMPKTALGLKVDPTDVAQNISGGLDYLKSQLDAFGGDTSMALAAYNAGPGVVKAYGKVPPYKETQGYVSRILSKLGPSSAEAATPAAPGMSRLEELEAELARRRESQTAPQAPPGTQAPAEEPITFERRFLDLPSVQQLPLAERTQRFKEFYGLRPEFKEEFLRSEEPPSDLTVDIEKPSPPRAVGGGQSREQQILAEARARQLRGETQAGPLPPGLPTVEQETLQEGITAPSTMIPLIMGVGIPGLTTAAPGMAAAERLVGKAGPLITRGARAAAEGLSQTAGWTAGRTIETGQVPSAGEIGTEAALNVAAGGILEGLGATGQGILRRSQAGKAILAAEAETTAARQAWQQEVATAKAEQQAGRTEAYQAAERRAREAQVRYQTKVEARDAKIAAGDTEYQEALTASKAEVQAEQARRYGQARTETMEEVGAAQTRQQQYQQAVTGQEQALTQARAVPGRYTPETPSWVMYEKFGDAAKDAVVDLTPAKTALAEVRTSRGVLPDGTARPLPAAVESIAANLEKATGETSFTTIREELRRLGPLTRSQDGNVRGAAKQLFGIYADVLEASPLANDLLRNANATFRKEMAVRDVAEWLTPGHGIVRIDNQGRETINVGALMTRLEKTVADDSLFRRSFAPDELDALRTDLRKLAGTPTMPRGTMPPAATPELLPGAAPNIPASMTTPTPKAIPPEVPRPRVEMLPGGAGPGRRVPGAGPEPSPVTPREALGERPKVFKGLTKIAARDYLSTLIGVPPGLVAGSRLLWRGGQQLRYGMARALLNVEARPQLMETLRKVKGVVGPPLYGTMVNVLSDAERKALLRDTRETRERKR